MKLDECAFAALQLTAFLKQVGPVESTWAMNTALEVLQTLPKGDDHVAAVVMALDESMAECDELAPAADSEPADGGGEALLAEGLAPEASAKKSGKAS